MPHTPMMTSMLKTADPTMVPTPRSPFVINTPASQAREQWSHMRYKITLIAHFTVWYQFEIRGIGQIFNIHPRNALFGHLNL